MYGGEKIISFGLNGGGDYIAFEYRKVPKDANPPVVIVYHDDYMKDKNDDTKMSVIKVADNFDYFLKMLHE